MIGVSIVRDSIQFTRIFSMQRKDGAKEENSEVIEISIQLTHRSYSSRVFLFLIFFTFRLEKINRSVIGFNCSSTRLCIVYTESF